MASFKAKFLVQVLQELFAKNHRGMAGETGGGTGGRDLPLRAPLISFPGWGVPNA